MCNKDQRNSWWIWIECLNTGDGRGKSSIEFMGKVRKLGRTNMAIRREMARMGEEVSKLGELDNKEFNKLMRDMKKIVKQLISPITP